MRFTKLFFAFSVLVFTLFACKDENKQDQNKTAIDAADTTNIKRAPKKELTTEDKKIISSVLFKIMSHPQLKKFASALVSVDAKDILSNGEGPYTVLAPTNAAFEAIPDAKMNPFLKPENKANFNRLIKNHIVKGKFSSQDLLDKIKSEGKVVLETLGDASLTATKSGDFIIIEADNGTKAAIFDKDIYGANGVVHIIGSVLHIK